MTFEQLRDIFGQTTFDNSSSSQQITLFDRNQLWYILKEISKFDIRFKHTSAIQTRKIINELLINNLVEYADLYTIESNITDEKVKLSVIDNDENLVIWNDYTNNQKQNKIFQISRYRGVYLPYLEIAEKFNDSEIFVSSKDIIVQTNVNSNANEQTVINYFDLLQEQTGRAEQLLNHYYKLEYIVNELNQRIAFSNNLEILYNIIINPASSFSTRFEKLNLVFTRK